jgi:RNA polymerase sigma-70 factor (ECF subfamily)
MEPLPLVPDDPAAFEALFRLHYRPLCIYAKGYLYDLDQAEDLVQELFLRLWLDRQKQRDVGNVKAYLYAAVRNRCLSALKVAVRVIALEDGREPAAEVSVPEDEHLERIARVQAAIGSLPTERQRIFVMCKYEGLKYQEIADRLGISVKTVENQMGKALKDLRIELADLVPVLPWLFFFAGGDGGIG